MSRLATPEGTARYAQRHEAAAGYWRDALGLRLSALGFGSYLGDSTDEADDAYAEAFAHGLRHGVNVLDTAANYRGRRSERAVGRAIRGAGVPRDEFLVATKGGFIPYDPASALRPEEFFQAEYVEPGIASPEDVALGCHVMTPRYLDHELDASLRALGLDGVDVYFLHNPESQLRGGLPRKAFERRLHEVFARLEEHRAEGRIGVYGLATWNALRVGPQHPEHIPLARVLEIATEAGGEAHGFRALELPYSIGMPEARAQPTQPWKGRMAPPLEVARDAGLLVLGSATLLQTRLLGRLDEDLRAALGAGTDVEAAIQFSRATPGLTSALVGTGRKEHAEENVKVRKLPEHPEAVRALLGP